jgi:two-component system chemotaxis sensor kinase CheA
MVTDAAIGNIFREIQSFLHNQKAIVAALSSKLGKEVQLRVLGENTELDKTVMEKIGDPLVHLVRNALDHGLETPDIRLAAGKSASGTLTLNAYHEGGGIVIEISDDGAGLTRQKILEKAREKGICGPAENPSDAQVTITSLRLAFRLLRW